MDEAQGLAREGAKRMQKDPRYFSADSLQVGLLWKLGDSAPGIRTDELFGSSFGVYRKGVEHAEQKRDAFANASGRDLRDEFKP